MTTSIAKEMVKFVGFGLEAVAQMNGETIWFEGPGGGAPARVESGAQLRVTRRIRGCMVNGEADNGKDGEPTSSRRGEPFNCKILTSDRAP